MWFKIYAVIVQLNSKIAFTSLTKVRDLLAKDRKLRCPRIVKNLFRFVLKWPIHR